MPGLWAALAVVLVQRMLHGAFHQAPFAPYATAEWFIRKSPGPIATWAIENLGHNAQSLLGWSFIAGTLALGYAIGRRPAWLFAAVAFVLTIIAAYLSPLANDVAGAISSAMIASITAYVALFAFQRGRPVEGEPEVATASDSELSRRQFLARAGLGVIVVGVAGTAALREGARTPKGLVRADQPAVIPVDRAFPDVPGLATRVTSREDHYVVDINLEDPIVGMSGWRLEIDGAVAAPLSLSLRELEAMTTIERVNNLTCISNEVGGDLIGNSRWTGVPLDTLLDMAQVRQDAVAFVAHAADGYTDVIRLEETAGKGALIAFGMNGELLARNHGFPARMLFPDHYGMRNVKWLTRIELITGDNEGYWAQRGWDREAVIRTQSRFDVPEGDANVRSPFVCAGIAWAGARLIDTVEVSTDDGGTWQPADLEDAAGPLSWRRWQLELDLPPGEYKLAVRATDGTGTKQDIGERRPHPSGASGYHRISVRVLEV